MAQQSNFKNPFHGFWALTHRDLKKWYKNSFFLLLSIIQPIIWMGLFGKAMNISAIFTNNPITLPPNLNLPPSVQTQLEQTLSDISTQMFQKTFGTADYFAFMSVGMLAFVVLFTTMFSGMSIVWDRRLGFLDKVLSTPVARGTILMSKVFSAVIRSLMQASIVLVFAFVLGLKIRPDFTPLNLLGVFVALFLISTGLSTIFILIAIRSTRFETPMAVMNLLNLPLLFASNTLFPTSLMPDWLQTVVKVNPITYANDAIRLLILYPMDMSKLVFDFVYLGLFSLVFASISILISWRYLSR